MANSNDAYNIDRMFIRAAVWVSLFVIIGLVLTSEEEDKWHGSGRSHLSHILDIIDKRLP